MTEGETECEHPLFSSQCSVCEWAERDTATQYICVCRGGALWLAYHRTQTQSATQWEFLFNPSTDIDSYYSYDTRTQQKCFIRTGYSFQPSIRLNSNIIIINESQHFGRCYSCLRPLDGHSMNRFKKLQLMNLFLIQLCLKLHWFRTLHFTIARK